VLANFFLRSSEMASFASWLDGIMAEIQDNKEMERPREVRPVSRVPLCENKNKDSPNYHSLLLLRAVQPMRGGQSRVPGESQKETQNNRCPREGTSSQA
jgi:hypothetical protein